MNGECLAGLRAVYRYRPDERMAGIDCGVTRHELLTGLEKPAGARDPLQPQRRVERLARLLSEELRAIATDMRSRDGGEPFAQSMRRVADRHPHIDLQTDGDLERIGALARFEVLRIVEEGLRNAERHAGATAIVARVALNDGHVELEVEDNGRGIDTDDFDLEQLAERGRYGLIGIRERAELLRGTLTIERRPQGGTLVRVAFPLTGP